MKYLARVSEQHRNSYTVVHNKREWKAKVAGKLIYQAKDETDYPVVGDYVTIDSIEDSYKEAMICEIHPRKNKFSRTSAGTTGKEQIIASNIDMVFICMSVNQDFNVSRLERYLVALEATNIKPFVILTKADLTDHISEYIERLHNTNKDLEILVTSSESKEGIDKLKCLLLEDVTVAFVGSSGVGKSTIVNELIGETCLRTNTIREDGRGKHTTTHRQLITLSNGATIIDTPGMREFALEESDVSGVFEDIEELALSCRFRNCNHETEPNCAVRRAILDGTLSQKRYDNYVKLKKEEDEKLRRKKKRPIKCK